MGIGGSKKKKGEDTAGTGKLFNVVVLGAGGVGKSALTLQFVQDKFIKDYDPTIEDSYRKQIVVDGKVTMMTIYDTAGQEEYEALQDQFIKESDGAIIVYTITDTASLHSLRKFYMKCARIKDTDNVPIVVVGNKADLEDQREVMTSQGKDIAQEFGAEFLETSAKTRLNVDEVFSAIVRKIRANQPDE